MVVNGINIEELNNTFKNLHGAVLEKLYNGEFIRAIHLKQDENCNMEEVDEFVHSHPSYTVYVEKRKPVKDYIKASKVNLRKLIFEESAEIEDLIIDLFVRNNLLKLAEYEECMYSVYIPDTDYIIELRSGEDIIQIRPCEYYDTFLKNYFVDDINEVIEQYVCRSDDNE